MEIQKYKEGDEEHIIDLFLKSFGKPISMDFWKWRYDNNPFTAKKMILLMWDNGKLVGHYAVFPVEINYFGENRLTALSMTTMTHPEYGGKGIFTTLASQLYEMISKDENVMAVWGFPNVNSHYAFNTKLEWKDVGIVHTLALSPKRSRLSLCDYTLSENFHEKHAAILSTMNSEIISVNKTVNYLKWRYKDNPTNDYKILETGEGDSYAFAVVKIFDSFKEKDRQEIDILEIGAYSPGNISNIVGGIIKFCSDSDIEWISMNLWMNLQDKRHIQFEKFGFVPDAPLTIHGCRTFEKSSDPMYNANSWTLSMGDSDVY